MSTWFQCPECHAIHEEPLSAAFVVSARCAQCELDIAIAEACRDAGIELPAAA
jgi:hypothetical protein